jgi:four helix bundle protein
MKNNGYKDLLIWQVGMDLVEEVYRITEYFPVDEKFGLISQLRRAVVSIPSNIGEGYYRKTDADFLNFLHFAYGSATEVETQLLIAVRLRYISNEQFELIYPLLNRFVRLLNGFIQSRDRKSVGGR